MQRVRQYNDVDQPDVAFASLDSTDIVSMQVRQLRQAFLRKAAFHPQFANASADSTRWSWLRTLSYMVRREHYEFYTLSV